MIDNSPRTIAAFHVLHRRNVPRHPPCAPTTNNNKKATLHPTTHTKHCMHNGARINQTKYKKKRLLASTIQFSHNTPTPHATTTHRDTHPWPGQEQQPCAIPDTQQCTNAPQHSVSATHHPPPHNTRVMIVAPHANHVPQQAIHPQKQKHQRTPATGQAPRQHKKIKAP